MTEKQRIRDHIREGASIVEACENADLTLLREEGEHDLAACIESILTEVEILAETLNLFKSR